MGGLARVGKTPDGTAMHYSVGALIERDGKYLLLERAFYPPGWAGPAGHLDDGEDIHKAIVREVKEETGLEVTKHELIMEELITGEMGTCHSGFTAHHWYVFRCEVEGVVALNNLDHEEAKGFGWYTLEELKNIELELVWKHWFKKLGIL